MHIYTLITILYRTNIVHVVIENVISLSEIIRIGMIIQTQCEMKSLDIFLHPLPLHREISVNGKK